MAARSTSSTTPSRTSAGTWCGPIRTTSASFERAMTPKTKAIFIEFDRQSRRHRHRHRGDRRGGAQGRRAADRRQHAGDALSDPADRPRRRHRGALAHEVPRWPRQFDRRHHRRRRHLRLVARRQISDAERAAPGISRHQAPGDLRQLRLRDRLPRAGPARPRPGAVAVQRLPDPDRHRDAAAADAEALRQRQGGRRMAVEASGGGAGQLRRPCRRPLSQPAAQIFAEGRRRGVHLRPEGRLRGRHQPGVEPQAVLAPRQCRRHPLAGHPSGLDHAQPAHRRAEDPGRRRRRTWCASRSASRTRTT